MERLKGNCHEYCIYAKLCYAKGEVGKEPFDCTNYYHLDDINNDAKEIEAEQRKAREEDDEW